MSSGIREAAFEASVAHAGSAILAKCQGQPARRRRSARTWPGRPGEEYACHVVLTRRYAHFDPSMPSLRKFEWEAAAGLLAAVAALILHFLHVSDAGIIRAITLVLVALLFLRDFRNEDRWEQLGAATRQSVHLLEELRAATPRSEVDLIGPSRLRAATAQFASRCQGAVVWFNACPEMLATKELCDAILHPFLVNPRISTIRFVFDHLQRNRWQEVVQSTLEPYLESGKILAPTWGELDSGVSFMLAETDAAQGKAEALVSVWGAPFMAVHHERHIPGYIMHVREHSELIGRLREVERACGAA